MQINEFRFLKLCMYLDKILLPFKYRDNAEVFSDGWNGVVLNNNGDFARDASEAEFFVSKIYSLASPTEYCNCALDNFSFTIYKKDLAEFKHFENIKTITIYKRYFLNINDKLFNIRLD